MRSPVGVSVAKLPGQQYDRINATGDHSGASSSTAMSGELLPTRVLDLGVEGASNINNLTVSVVSSSKDVIRVNSQGGHCGIGISGLMHCESYRTTPTTGLASLRGWLQSTAIPPARSQITPLETAQPGFWMPA